MTNHPNRSMWHRMNAQIVSGEIEALFKKRDDAERFAARLDEMFGDGSVKVSMSTMKGDDGETDIVAFAVRSAKQ